MVPSLAERAAKIAEDLDIDVDTEGAHTRQEAAQVEEEAPTVSFDDEVTETVEETEDVQDVQDDEATQADDEDTEEQQRGTVKHTKDLGRSRRAS